jgi:hypothetical protein
LTDPQNNNCSIIFIECKIALRSSLTILSLFKNGPIKIEHDLWLSNVASQKYKRRPVATARGQQTQPQSSTAHILTTMEAIKNIKEKFNSQSVVSKVVIGIVVGLFLLTLGFGGYKGYQYVTKSAPEAPKETKEVRTRAHIPNSASSSTTPKPSNRKNVKGETPRVDLANAPQADSSSDSEADSPIAPKEGSTNGQAQQANEEAEQ